MLRSPALWLGVALGVVELTDSGPFDPYSPTTFIPPLVALIYLIFAASRHGADRSAAMRIQAVGLVCFTAVSVVTLIVDPAIGRYLIAAGWLAHAAWDFAHRDGRVVPKWIVRFCVPFDLLVATSLVVGTWS
ncbi:hypothetical protein D7223_16730 [Micromonospora endolithica]|uniref:Uncharacterized protein n=1 Tax=Micromonospora endolithica TaxID=230091 RepID=A0A3A9ZAM1_9ACTN|nr:hypothetical protein D7223_16730 [Micromonospora endolithica]